MKKGLLIILFLTVYQISLGQQKTIFGKTTGFKNNTKVKLYDQELMKLVDSTYIQNNTFILKNPAINSVPRNFTVSIIDSIPKYLRLFISNEDVKISGDKKDFPFDLQITGSKTQNEVNILNFKTKTLLQERNEIVKFWKTDVIDKTENYQLKLNKSKIRAQQIDKLLDSITIQFINANVNSYVALKELSYLRTKYIKSDLQKIYSKLDTKFKKSKAGISLLNYIQIGDVVRKNDFFSDFEGFDNTGLKHKLSDFKGNFILLDFTKEFCEPCEKAIKELKILSEKYNDKIKIISFTGEKSEDFWKKGIVRNNIKWLSLWDGNGVSSKTLMKYGVTGFPHFYLINQKGQIVKIIEGYSNGILEPAVIEMLKQ